MMAAAAATSAATGAATAAAWAPAASAVSLATFGANAGPAIAGITSTYALTKGLSLAGGLGLKDGGWVSGPGGPRDDAIPAMLSNGEFVVNAKAANDNAELLEAINKGMPVPAMIKRAEGGWASRATYEGAPQRASNDQMQVVSRDTATTSQAANVMNNIAVQPAAPEVNVPVKVVNVTNPEDMIDAMNTSAGEEVVMNIIERNPQKVARLLER